MLAHGCQEPRCCGGCGHTCLPAHESIIHQQCAMLTYLFSRGCGRNLELQNVENNRQYAASLSIYGVFAFSRSMAYQVLIPNMVSLVFYCSRSMPFDRGVAASLRIKHLSRCPDFAVPGFIGAYVRTCLTQAVRCCWDECAANSPNRFLDPAMC
jgi:hypothetical protein